ncbi:MAG: hypothetical protein SPL57_00080 [Lachnospiraceae bacterium]|nr:hypothetical protein [Lachnospiraceae bacterium]
MWIELKKLVRIRRLWIFALILIMGNLILLNRNSGSDITYDSYEYTRKEYVDYLDQIPMQTRELLRERDYKNKESFLYRNLIKTREDYSDLTGNGFVKGKYRSLVCYSRYPYQMIFVAIWAVIAAYQLISIERKKGLFLLLKSTRKGHGTLYASKALALAISAATFSITIDMTELLFLRYRFGFFGINALLQSESLFRDCPFDIKVGSALLLMVVLHILTAVFSVILIQALLSMIRRNELSLLFYSAFYVIEWILMQRISINSDMNMLAAVNPFYQSSAEMIIGNYLNINIAGYPVGQLTAGLFSIAFFTIIAFLAGIIAFSVSFQTAGEGIVEYMIRLLRKKLSFLWHTDRISLFETRKLLLHSRKAVLLAVFTLMILWTCSVVMKPLVFAKEDDAEYHRLTAKVQGVVTEKKLAYIRGERKKLDDLIDEARSLGDSTEDEARRNFISFEYRHRNGGLSKLEEQRDMLIAMKGDKKYFFDEAALLKEFSDINSDLLLFLMTGISLVLILNGIDSYDSQMYSLIFTTEAGERTVRRKKALVSYMITAILFLLWNIPDLLSYMRIDRGRDLLAPMTQITGLSIHRPVCEGLFLMLLFIIRLGIIFLLSFFIQRTALYFRSPAAVGAVGISAIIVITLICSLSGIDIVTVMIRLLSI